MARRRPTETLDDLLASVLPPGMSIGEWGESVGVPQRTLFRLRHGLVDSPRLGTLTLLAQGMKVDVARVRAAVAASRAAVDRV